MFESLFIKKSPGATWFQQITIVIESSARARFDTSRRSFLEGSTHSHPQPRALALDLSGFEPPIGAYQPTPPG